MQKQKMKYDIKTRMENVFIIIAVGLAGFITIYPFLYVFSMSISSYEAAMKQAVWLYPIGFNLGSYEKILQHNGLWRSYANTIFYTSSGTFLTLIMSIISAYPLAKKRLVFRKAFIFFMLIPMYFQGGIIPKFIIYNKLGMYNSILVMIIPTITDVWYIILMLTFFRTLPYSLSESAYIDGANDFQILFKIIVPISKPILAVITLYSAVTIWNSWFTALIFLSDRNLHPLQLFLARILVFGSPEFKNELGQTTKDMIETAASMVQLKYAATIFCTLPIIFSYPFLQKYFVKGALIGSLKG